MKAKKIQIDNEYDEFFSLNIFCEENPPISIMLCRDATEDYDVIIYNESLDKLYCIYTNSTELSYQFQGNQLLFTLTPLSPHFFYNTHDKVQIIELAHNDIAKVQAILEKIFISFIQPIKLN